MAISYWCEGCGAHVYSAGEDKIPSHHLCHGCGFVEVMIPDMTVRQSLHEHLGHMRKVEGEVRGWPTIQKV
jgi:MinD superfamily P-loop ATPase